jgi:hypothetical protein
MNRPNFTAKNAPKIAEVKLSSCGLELADSKKIAIAELRLRSNISLKVAEFRLRKCLLLVAELRLRTQKKLRVPTSGICLVFVNLGRGSKIRRQD